MPKHVKVTRAIVATCVDIDGTLLVILH